MLPNPRTMPQLFFQTRPLTPARLSPHRIPTPPPSIHHRMPNKNEKLPSLCFKPSFIPIAIRRPHPPPPNQPQTPRTAQIQPPPHVVTPSKLPSEIESPDTYAHSLPPGTPKNRPGHARKPAFPPRKSILSPAQEPGSGLSPATLTPSRKAPAGRASPFREEKPGQSGRQSWAMLDGWSRPDLEADRCSRPALRSRESRTTID